MALRGEPGSASGSADVIAEVSCLGRADKPVGGFRRDGAMQRNRESVQPSLPARARAP
jgi:hypothetical protein